jgi:hypothetical protein
VLPGVTETAARWSSRRLAARCRAGSGGSRCTSEQSARCAGGARAADDPLDLLHARWIDGSANVEIVAHEPGGHRPEKTLRDLGLLKPVLRGTMHCG